MCGICGIINQDREKLVDRKMIVAMARSMKHRGPDDEGFFVENNVGLGHQRLSIIDLSPNARQPISNEDGSLYLVFNGEIYNYLELRKELVAKGHVFRSQSDSEVIIHLYEDKGFECVTHLNGMYAFAIWDARKQLLFSTRDRFGIKPFYYSLHNGCFAFASEIKALFKTGWIVPEHNPEGLNDYLAFQFCLGGKTLFKDVHKLLPGHFMILSNGNIKIQKYWDFDFSIDTDHNKHYFEEKLAELIRDSIRIQLRSDVPLGAHLSGGLDSTTVTCLASDLLNSPIKTFSGGFKFSPLYDETSYARIASDYVNSEHYEIFPTEDDFVDILPKLIYYMDEPAAGPGVFPQYFVSKLASENVKVVLGGQGGDEIFGGYTRYLIAYLEECIKGGIAGTQEPQKYVVSFESILPNLTQLQGYESLLRHFWKDGLFESEDRRYFRLIDRRDGTPDLINEDFLAPANEYDTFEEYRELFMSTDCHSLINKITRFDMMNLLPALLHVEDRTSMACSLESRVPLLDHRIVELVASMPPMIKYKGGRSKYIFRQVVQNIIPHEIYDRTDKMGFPVPLNEWFAGPLKDFVHDILSTPKARKRGIFTEQGLVELLKPQQQYGRALWGALNLELWFQTFIDR